MRLVVAAHPGRFAHRRRWITAAVVVGVGVPTLLTAVAYAYDRLETGRLPPGIEIAGVDVGGMTEAQTLQVVRRRFTERLSQQVEVRAAGREWVISARALGVHADVRQAVDRAFPASADLASLARGYHRLFDWPVDERFAVPLRVPPERVRSFLSRVASAIDRPARNAAITLSANDMQTGKQHARPGVALDRTRAGALLERALRNAIPIVRLPIRPIEPSVRDSELGATITIDLSNNRLRLYQGFRIARSYPVATARPGFSTPVGVWHIASKVKDPSWTNPDPTGWGAGLPSYIPPGPDNPLGLRALYLDAPGIRIHGTPESWSVGTYASHGCIRMYEADVIALYRLVHVGTRVVIFGAPP